MRYESDESYSTSADAVRILIENGADVNTISPEKKNTTLILFSQRGYIDITKYLLRNGADINIKDKDGKTALNYAEKNNKMKKLLEKYDIDY